MIMDDLKNESIKNEKLRKDLENASTIEEFVKVSKEYGFDIEVADVEADLKKDLSGGKLKELSLNDISNVSGGSKEEFREGAKAFWTGFKYGFLCPLDGIKAVIQYAKGDKEIIVE